MTTYATLQSDIADWLIDDDITSKVATFIRLCEASIRRDVYCRAQETSADITITAGTAPLPTGFVEAHRLILDNASSWALEYQPPDVLYSSAAYRETEISTRYTIEGDNIIFRPTMTGTAKLLYVKAFDALSGSTDTNWLLTNAYDVYLYGSLIHAAPFIKDDARIQVWNAGYERAVTAVNKQENRARSSGGGLIVSGVCGP